MQRPTCVLVVFGLLLATAGLAFTQAAPVHHGNPGILIPTSQRSCTFNEQIIAGSVPFHADSRLKVTVNNGTVARNVKIETSSETLVDTAGALLFVGYLIDGVFLQVGPEMFSSDNFWGTRTSMGVITLGAGVHTIVPDYFYNGAIGTNAFIGSRCLTAEKATN